MHAMKALTERSTEDKKRVAFRMGSNGLVVLVGMYREKHIYTVDINRLSMMKHIPTNIGVDVHALQDDEIIRLIYQAYLYALRLSNTKTMRRLTTVPKDLVTGMKDSLFMSRDILRYKIATMRCVLEDLTPRDVPRIEQHFKACELTADDTIFFHLLYHNQDLDEFRKLIQLCSDDRFVVDIKSIPLELELNTKGLNAIKKQASYFAYRKLKFIANGQRFHSDDMLQDLVERATQAYYWVRPFYTIEHAINYAKRAMHGHMNCLIAYYNDDCRRRITEDVGFGSTNTSCDYSDEQSYADTQSRNFMEDAMIEFIDMKKNVL
jgi:hypothetical protein